MHYAQFQELLRDAEIAHVISPIVQKRQLTFDEVRDALRALNIPRGDSIARVVTSP